MKEKIDLRTPLQRKRDERDEKLYARYTEMKAKVPEGSAWSMCRVLAGEFKMRPQGVRNALNRTCKKLGLEKTSGGYVK